MAMDEEVQNLVFEIAVKEETTVVANRLLNTIHVDGPQPPPGGPSGAAPSCRGGP